MAVRDLVRQTRQLAASARSRSSTPLPLTSDSFPEIVPYLNTSVRRNTRSPAVMMADNPLVFGPIWKIALRMGALPIKVYTFGAGDVRSEDRGHPAYGLLRRPNPAMTRNLVVAHTVVDMFAHGRAAWLKRRDDDGNVFELWPLYGQLIRPIHDERTLIGGYKIITTPGREIRLRTEDVCYFRLMPNNSSLADGVTPFTALAAIAGLGGTAINAGTDMFDHALLGRLSATIKKDLSPTAFRRLKRQLEAMRRDKYAIPLLEDGMELKDHAGPSDEVVVNAMRESRAMIRDALGLPDDDTSTAFYKNAIQPIADAMEQEWERSLMPEWPEREAFPEFAFRDELRGDPKERAELHQARILSGQETPNEARRDENLPPKDGGDVLMVPLNLVPIEMAEDVASSGEPRKKDSAGGLGGDEGKGTLVAASAQPGALGRLAASALVAEVDAAMAQGDESVARKSAGQTKWGELRDRLVKRHSQAMARKVRGELNKEAKAIKAALNDGRQARAEVSLPSAKEIRKIIARSDKDVADILEQFMRQTADTTGPAAADMLDHELTEGALDRLHEVYASRASSITERFAGVRGDRVVGLVEQAVAKSTPVRELAGQIGEAYSSLSTAYTDGIARTEVAFAHEQAALVTWADAGVRQIEIVFGGGECTTGVCEDNANGGPYRLGETLDNVGVSFEGADAPPFHPGCTCFAVPFIEAGRSTLVPPTTPKIERDAAMVREMWAEMEQQVRAANPGVNVNVAPPHITVVMPDGRKRSVKRIERDEQGNAVAIIEEEE